MLADADLPHRKNSHLLVIDKRATAQNWRVSYLPTPAGPHLAPRVITGVTTAQSKPRHALLAGLVLLHRSVLASTVGSPTFDSRR